jgi:ribose/xylose/arabinose/galactoside ABC-type transport system permease subunit
VALAIVLNFVLAPDAFGYLVQALGSNLDAALFAGFPARMRSSSRKV